MIVLISVSSCDFNGTKNNNSKEKAALKKKTVVKTTKTKAIKIRKAKPDDNKPTIEDKEQVIVSQKIEEMKEEDFLKILKENGIEVDENDLKPQVQNTKSSL